MCDLRFWLNGEFALAAFDNAQRTRIARSELVNKDNDEYGTRGGEVTRDHVFCLSLDEVARYLATDANTHSHVGIARKDLVTIPTEYAKSRHINYDTVGGDVVWWLRSPGDDAAEAAYAYSDGSVDSFGDGVDYGYYGVRPALWLVVDDVDEGVDGEAALARRPPRVRIGGLPLRLGPLRRLCRRIRGQLRPPSSLDREHRCLTLVLLPRNARLAGSYHFHNSILLKGAFWGPKSGQKRAF